MSSLDRLYSELTIKTGISRVRDTRLERIAMDRALEVRWHQGLILNAANPIEHEWNQLKARVYPWQVGPGATENVTWHYYPPNWADPIDAAVDATLPDGSKVGWWNSDAHRAQLLDTRWTHWGHGVYFEDTPLGARRWYFATVFAEELVPLEQTVLDMDGGRTVGFHFTAAGTVIHRQSRVLPASEVRVDEISHIPGRGMYFHLASRPMKGYWISSERFTDEF